MKNIMIDLETLGTQSTAGIIQIGACYFDKKTGEIGKTFSRNTISNHPDFTNSFKTITFWNNQPETTKEMVFSNAIPIQDALTELIEFCKDGKYMWSHATFDIPILMNAINLFQKELPIHYRSMRDIRTLMDVKKYKDKKERKGTHHNAIDDCIYQVEYVVAALNKKEINTNDLEQMQEDIRTLRDNHECPNDKDDSLECTCHQYDRIIDNIQKLID